jgi:hypothetical protein
MATNLFERSLISMTVFGSVSLLLGLMLFAEFQLFSIGGNRSFMGTISPNPARATAAMAGLVLAVANFGIMVLSRRIALCIVLVLALSGIAIYLPAL